MVTREQLLAVRAKINEVRDLLDALASVVDVALIEYMVEGNPKYLPQEDLEGLYRDYEVVKQKIIEKFKELP